MVSGVSACVRYLLFFFNLIFALTGLAIVVVSALAQVKLNEHDYSRFIADSFLYIPMALMVVGSIIAIIAFFGCCGAVKESHCMLISFGVMLIALFFVELGSGAAGYMFRDEVVNGFETRMNAGVREYYDDHNAQKIMDGMQIDLQCCGTRGATDYDVNRIPNTCCSGLSPDAICTQQSAYTVGCLTTLENIFANYGIILLSVASAIGIIQLIGIVFAFCLARTIRQGYETV